MSSVIQSSTREVDQAAQGTLPKVSIGVPVYNGEKYLEEALASITGQTFHDMEIVISDNASSDRTPEICHEFMASDSRIRYHRNETNLGSAANWNLVLELARGEYFKWAADDDVLGPTYIEKCADVLERDPGVVVCHSQTIVLKSDGERTPLRETPGLDQPRASDRFAAVALQPHWTLEAHGLIRAAALRAAQRTQPYWGSDKAVVAELVLMGRIVRVEEPLFLNRDHPGRTMRAVTFAERLTFHDPNKRMLPQWSLYKDYVRAVRTHVKDPAERRRCYVVLARWWVSNWNILRAGLDLVAAVAPGLSDLAFRMRERYHSRGIGTH